MKINRKAVIFSGLLLLLSAGAFAQMSQAETEKRIAFTWRIDSVLVNDKKKNIGYGDKERFTFKPDHTLVYAPYGDKPEIGKWYYEKKVGGVTINYHGEAVYDDLHLRIISLTDKALVFELTAEDIDNKTVYYAVRAEDQ